MDCIQYHQKIDRDISHIIDGQYRQYCIRLNFWKLPHHKRFNHPPPLYFRKAHCVIIIFDVTNRSSFQRIEFWVQTCWEELDDMRRKISIAIVGNKIDLTNDCQRQVSYQEAIELCDSFAVNNDYFAMDINHSIDLEQSKLICDGYLRQAQSIHNILIPMDIYPLCFTFYCSNQPKSTINYFETSAKTGDGLNEMFESLIATKLEIDHYHPYKKVRMRNLIEPFDEEKYTSCIRVKGALFIICMMGFAVMMYQLGLSL